MKKHKYVILGAIALLIIGFIVYVVASPAYFDDESTIISHKYPLTNTKELIVDTHDCGATCDFNTAVYVRSLKEDGQWKKTEEVFNCYGTVDAELTDITPTSAKISSIKYTSDSDCTYKAGDTITFNK
jgi:hypothetical protein